MDDDFESTISEAEIQFLLEKFEEIPENDFEKLEAELTSNYSDVQINSDPTFFSQLAREQSKDEKPPTSYFTDINTMNALFSQEEVQELKNFEKDQDDKFALDALYPELEVGAKSNEADSLEESDDDRLSVRTRPRYRNVDNWSFVKQAIRNSLVKSQFVCRYCRDLMASVNVNKWFELARSEESAYVCNLCSIIFEEGMNDHLDPPVSHKLQQRSRRKPKANDSNATQTGSQRTIRV